MKNYRIALVEYDHKFVGQRKTYALQRRVGLLFWYTVARASTVQQCLEIYDNVKGRKEKIINVLRTFG